MAIRPFDELSKRGQAQRLKRLAIQALRQYELEVTSIRLAGLFTNAIFRLCARNGRTYALRVCTPGWRTAEDLASEVMWLLALARDTDIPVPEPYPARHGDFIVEAGAPGVPEMRRCLVMNWLPGSLLGRHLNEANLFKMGLLFAELHDHATHFAPPEGFTQRKMDSIFARGEPNVFFSADCQEGFTPRTRDILRRAGERVTTAFGQLYNDPAGLQVIHNDLHHDNIKLHHGRLCPLDFEDTIWGYPVQDIAMALQDLMVDVAPDAYMPLRDAFQAGYESSRSWPETYAGQIDTFRAGRMLWVASYVARYEREYLAEFVAWLAERFEDFLETGVLRKR
jgi:Ser/Thr protein kinase RdoA (MazF antagonist)